LSLGVIAEGVETTTQIEELKRLGCHRAQGFYFAPALRADAAHAAIAAGTRLLRPLPGR